MVGCCRNTTFNKELIVVPRTYMWPGVSPPGCMGANTSGPRGSRYPPVKCGLGNRSGSPVPSGNKGARWSRNDAGILWIFRFLGPTLGDSPLAGCVVSWTPTWLDPELTGLPRANLAVGNHSQVRVPVQMPAIPLGASIRLWGRNFCIGVRKA